MGRKALGLCLNMATQGMIPAVSPEGFWRHLTSTAAAHLHVSLNSAFQKLEQSVADFLQVKSIFFFSILLPYKTHCLEL